MNDHAVNEIGSGMSCIDFTHLKLAHVPLKGMVHLIRNLTYLLLATALIEALVTISSPYNLSGVLQRELLLILAHCLNFPFIISLYFGGFFMFLYIISAFILPESLYIDLYLKV